ncbi:MAG TPA: protein-disulfide reductase DsbD domain-containing protein [Terriglobales bacterium]|nr:protein-disulfide reductase DsbD domain-containing protein [Terriglobales bacterium]
MRVQNFCGIRLIVSVLILLFTSLSFAADETRPGRIFVTFEGASPATVSPNKPAEVELNFRVKEGFHVNSNKPNSELLIPTTLKLEPPTDLSAGAIIFPPGKDISFPFDPSEKLNVYSDAFTVKAKLVAANTASTGNFTVHGQLRYQACNDNACFPPKNIPFQFDVHVVGASAKRHAK